MKKDTYTRLVKQSDLNYLFGYFENPSDKKPAYDPGLNIICPICAIELSRPIKTISLMKDGDSRSYFYRTHKSCYDNSTIKELTQLESSLIDSKPTNNETL